MNWNEFKQKCNNTLGSQIVKVDGDVCPISVINDHEEWFSYLINNNKEKRIYFSWILECVRKLEEEYFIRNQNIRAICKLDCDPAIISSLIVNQLEIARYDIPYGLKTPIGLIKSKK